MKALFLLILTLPLSAQFFPFPGPGRAPVGGGGGGSPTATFKNISTAAESSGSSTISTTTTQNIAIGDILVVGVWGGNSLTISGVTCGGNTLTAGQVWTEPGGYTGRLFYLASATTANATATCTATYSVAANFRTITSLVYTPSSSATFQAATCNGSSSCNALASASTDRTSANLTTSTANTLHIALGIDWDGLGVHSAANSYTLRFGAEPANTDTQFVYDKVLTSIGTYPSGNFGTSTSSEQYMAFYVTFGLS